jgi:hypothetical protein
MEGRSGTGRLGVTYYYYVCRDKACGLRVSADEVEGAVLDRLACLAADSAVVEKLTIGTNSRLQRQAPGLIRQRRTLEKNLADVNAAADKVLLEWSAFEGQEGRAFSPRS